MRQFHKLKVQSIEKETADSMRVALHIPDEFKNEYEFLPGQHLPIQISVDGRKIRRTYSICSLPGEQPLVLGIRVQPGGLFSEFVANELSPGDELEVMPPFGQFHASVEPDAKKTYLAFVAGSGISPRVDI